MKHSPSSIPARLIASLFWLATLGTGPATAQGENAPAADLVTRICSQCHGIDGNSTLGKYPRLAGQPAGYLAKQLNEFIAGNRQDPEMSPVAARLTADEIAGLANYFSQQKPLAGTPESSTLNEIGTLLYRYGNPDTGLPSCDGCHSPNAAGGGRFPRLAGQHREYIAKQLADIRQGRRNSSALMRAVADRMSELEVKAMAVYLSGL